MRRLDGDRARDEALDRVEAHASPGWLAAARRAVQHCAGYQWFSTDDVWARLEKMEVPEPREPRAMGAVMKGAHADGLIEPTSDWTTTSRVRAHSRPVRVWKRAT